MNFKLPKLQVFLNGNAKIQDTDVTKNIHVIGGHAIVSNDIIAIVNLREYVKRELKITDDTDSVRNFGQNLLQKKSFLWSKMV